MYLYLLAALKSIHILIPVGLGGSDFVCLFGVGMGFLLTLLLMFGILSTVATERRTT